ncbi:transporter substrate-binding domain-containing protein [Halobacteriovorax sp. JY17]|uniref:substrate-binding periplasmic protein n=1 Tax=Halobacteriovorax sp. JY17 TaxID=2014617 RepID=UPI000C5962C2|nr:transporter substrate-binding domain-containing protein [Halobacteriovorax sp. JY17]PIK16638.1 MAG: amino acid ABC transporter substrate-binding protein [Halobacteriovorax sp. JY17]
MKIFITLILLLLNFSVLSLEANLAVEDSWPPYSDKLGKGIATNIVGAAFNEVSIPVKITVFPYIRALRTVSNGELDGCYSVTKQESTQKQYHFGNEPILKSQASFFHHADYDFKFKNISEIPNGTSLVLIRGYEYGNNFEKYKKNFKIFYVNTQEQIISMIVTKRVSLTIMFDEVAKYYLRKNPRANEVKKAIPNHMSDIYVAFNLQSPKSKLLASKLDEGIRKLKASGKYEMLLRF